MKPEEKKVINSNDASASYNYCLNNKEVNISLHEDIICKSNDALYIYLFARDIKGANINKLDEAIIKSNELEEAIIKSNEAFYIYYFARDIKGANLDKFKDILKNSEFKEEFKALYEEYKKNKMSKEEQEVLAKNDPRASYNYCLNNKDANVRLHEDIIIKSNNVAYIYLFARDIKEAKVAKLEEAIIKTNDEYYIYAFAKNIKVANITKLEDVIIKSNSNDFIYLFAKDVKEANLDKFKNILENSEFKEEFKKLYNSWKEDKLKNDDNVEANTNSSSNLGSEKSEPESNQSNKNISKENKQMADSNMDFFKNNLIEGAYGGVAVVAVENVKKGLLAAAKSAGADEMSLAMASTFLDTPAGKSILSILVGSGVRFIPADIVQQNPHLQKVAEKCIQNAGSEGAQYAFKLATSYIMPALLNAVKDSPQLNMLNSINAADKVRVPTPENKEQAPDTEPSNVVEGAFNKASRAGLK